MARANQGGVAAAMCCKSIAGEALRHSPNEAGSWRVDASRVVWSRGARAASSIQAPGLPNADASEGSVERAGKSHKAIVD